MRVRLLNGIEEIDGTLVDVPNMRSEWQDG